MNIRTTILAAAVAMTGFGSSMPSALADVAPAEHRVLVRFADLALDKPAGIKALYDRLNYAAQQVCHSLDGRDLASRSAYKACVGDALARAVTEISQPDLQAYYRVKTQGRNATPVRVVASK